MGRAWTRPASYASNNPHGFQSAVRATSNNPIRSLVTEVAYQEWR